MKNVNNTIDKKYTNLLQDIIDNGVEKGDRTGTGTISVFGRQIRHKMSEGFPLLTTKKMAWKSMVTELIWFLRGDTNIKFLVDNGCNIWNGDAWANYQKKMLEEFTTDTSVSGYAITNINDFIDRIKNDEKFAKQWGELGPIYGAQWRDWSGKISHSHQKMNGTSGIHMKGIDQIKNLISELKTNPDSRRLMVNAWNVEEIKNMVLPPCHYGFQVYTRELSLEERIKIWDGIYLKNVKFEDSMDNIDLDGDKIPKRAISLMWNQRSVDTFLGLPFNISSYALLLMIIAKEVNMVPDELIGNLGDVHLYSNHIEQAKEQIGREYTDNELLKNNPEWLVIRDEKLSHIKNGEYEKAANARDRELEILKNMVLRTREPYELPNVKINYSGSIIDNINNIDSSYFILGNYQSHDAIKAPLSN